MRIYYCPKCGKLQITNLMLYVNEYSCANPKAGMNFMPVFHYRCECGNYLAGMMIYPEHTMTHEFVQYVKDEIEACNPGGRYYNPKLLSQIKECHKVYQKYIEEDL